jgi:arylsulfatase
MSFPNILLIVCDELRADALGCMGNRIVQTPNIDRLAHQGVLFSQCMVTQPTCTPSRASILTGLYPSALRSRMVGCRTPDDARFAPRMFGAQGYRTASIGKIHLVPQRAEPEAIADTVGADGQPDYYGFREIDLVNGHGDHCFGPLYSAWLSQQVPDFRERIARPRQYTPGMKDCYTYELPAEAHSSNYIGRRAVEFLQEASDQPFLLHVSFPDPHHPFTVPEPYASQYPPGEMPPPIPPVTESVDAPPLHLDAYFARNLRFAGAGSDRIIGTPPHEYFKYGVRDWQRVKSLYYGMISLIDESVGRILAALSDTGLERHTLVVFVSDHGDYLGDHGLLGKGLPYDSALRTPLIFRGPGIQAGRRIDSMASALDIAPTLLELAGIEECEGVQGSSLAGVLRGLAAPTRQAALTENDDDFVPARMRTLTTADWRLTYYCGEDFGELYDRRNDPQELVNLWNDKGYASRKAELLAMLMEEVVCSIDVSNGRVQQPRAPTPKWTPRHNRGG